MRGIAGLGAMAALAAMAFVGGPEIGRDPAPVPRRKGLMPRDSVPNDFGPVIDTTPESKRARRRRLAREARHA